MLLVFENAIQAAGLVSHVRKDRLSEVKINGTNFPLSEVTLISIKNSSFLFLNLNSSGVLSIVNRDMPPKRCISKFQLSLS